ncbi:hypothetical protein Tco_0217760 [Tanacetum coccineum]
MGSPSRTLKPDSRAVQALLSSQHRLCQKTLTVSYHLLSDVLQSSVVTLVEWVVLLVASRMTVEHTEGNIEISSGVTCTISEYCVSGEGAWTPDSVCAILEKCVMRIAMPFSVPLSGCLGRAPIRAGLCVLSRLARDMSSVVTDVRDHFCRLGSERALLRVLGVDSPLNLSRYHITALLTRAGA